MTIGGLALPKLEIHEETSPRPISKTANEELAYRLRQQRIAADFGYFALKNDSLEEMLQEAAKLAALGLNASHAKFLRHLGKGSGFLVKAGVGWKPGVVGRATVGDDMESPAGYAFHTEGAVISNHLGTEGRFRTPSLLAEHGIKRALNVIIRCDNERYGVLEVDSPGEGLFDEEDVAFMESFAAILGVAIQRNERAGQLREALRHREVLIQEASHRVKNSLTIIAGLLSLQSRTACNDETAKALRDAAQRVQTVAAVHDRLWRTSSTRSVDMREFLKELCEQLAMSAPGLTVTCDSVDIEVFTDQAVTIGLLVNELVTNAFKYAFADEQGNVTVRISFTDEQHLHLVVSDEGRGLPSNFDPMSQNSLGVRLIASLSRQLGGEPKWENANPGTRFMLDIVPASNHRILSRLS